MKKIFPAILVLLTVLLSFNQTQAQAQLSIQGILKKADGKAVDDGPQNLKFTLYTAAIGGTQVWTETQNGVEVAGGLYSVQLGAANPLTGVAFDVPYFLGVSVGTNSEMLPRMPLTSAPYALSLRGQTNQFPSTGQVKADYIVVPSGAPASGTAAKGYSFGTGGDLDGGLFSTTNGRVSLYTDATERLRASSSGVDVIGNGTVSGKLGVGGAASTTHSVNVTGGYLARGGTPGLNGLNNNGYAFQDQKGTGIFSRQTGRVNIFSDSLEVMEIYASGNTGTVVVSGALSVTGAAYIQGLPSGSNGVNMIINGGQIFKSTSSARYKDNITPFQTDFSLLLQAEPKKYTRKGKPNEWEIGFIAEEFAALGLQPLVIYDEQGRPEGLAYDKCVVYLIPLLREQSRKVATQAAQITALEAENAELRKMFSSLRADVNALKAQR